MNKEGFLRVMPRSIRLGLDKLSDSELDYLQEIRLRVGQPVLVKCKGEEYGLSEDGICKPQVGLIMTGESLEDALHCMSDFSLYAIEDEMKQGYLTLEGGHRVGLVGKAVIEQNTIKTLKHISGMNIRVAHEVIGCSQPVMPYIVARDKVYHTLIISPPGCGKTTLLRDIIRGLSEGYCGYGPYNIGVVDERSEIGACYRGIPQNRLGLRTDILDACPKVEGMRMLLRSMAPQIIAVDELGKSQDFEVLEEMLSAGVTIIGTVHGRTIEECLRRPLLKEILQGGLFERIIILSGRRGPCTIEAILDGTKNMCTLR